MCQFVIGIRLLII